MSVLTFTVNVHDAQITRRTNESDQVKSYMKHSNQVNTNKLYVITTHIKPVVVVLLITTHFVCQTPFMTYLAHTSPQMRPWMWKSWATFMWTITICHNNDDRHSSNRSWNSYTNYQRLNRRHKGSIYVSRHPTCIMAVDLKVMQAAQKQLASHS